MRYLLLVNGQMPVELKTGELSYQQLDGGSVPETAPPDVKSWFEGLAGEETFLATLRGVWGAATIDSWQHSACQPSAADQSDAESIRSRPSSEDTLNVLTMRASTLASETYAPLILGEGTGPGGAHQLGIFVAANVPKATAASVMQQYWRTVSPPFRPEEIEFFKKKGPETTSKARTRGHRAATKQGETKSSPDELTDGAVRLLKTFRLMDVPALEIAVYQNLRETAKNEGFFDQSPESARASLASALTYGLMAAKDLVKSGLPAEATKMDRRIYEYRSQLLNGMHGLASPLGFQTLVVRLMTAGEGEFEKSGKDTEALARSMTVYVLYALFCGPGGPPYPSIEESGILADLSWVFGGRVDGQTVEAKPKGAKFTPPKPTLPRAVDADSTSADAHSDAPVEFVYATVPTAWAVVLPPDEPEFIVLPRQVAQEQSELWSALEAMTWGDLRKRDPHVYSEACGLAGHTTFEDYAKHLSVGRPMPGALEEARKLYEESGDAPLDDARFELKRIAAFADGDWPPSYRMLMYENLPKGLAEQCGGEVYDTNFNGVFVEFPGSAADKVIKALEGHGYRCTLEPALITGLVNRRQ